MFGHCAAEIEQKRCIEQLDEDTAGPVYFDGVVDFEALAGRGLR
jgi:hypothetical protein